LNLCHKFSDGFVDERGNIRRPGPVPKFSDLEVIALCMVAETEEIDSENRFFNFANGERALNVEKSGFKKRKRAALCAALLVNQI